MADPCLERVQLQRFKEAWTDLPLEKQLTLKINVCADNLQYFQSLVMLNGGLGKASAAPWVKHLVDWSTQYSSLSAQRAALLRERMMS